MSKEKFIQIAAKIFPHIEEVRRIMAENGIEGLCSINADRDEYASLSFHAAPYCLYQVGISFSISDGTGDGLECEKIDWPIATPGGKGSGA